MRSAYKPATVNKRKALRAPCSFLSKCKHDSLTFENRENKINSSYCSSTVILHKYRKIKIVIFNNLILYLFVTNFYSKQ